MEEQDYIELQTLLSKLEIVIGKEYINCNYGNMKKHWSKRLRTLQEGINIVRANVFFTISGKEKEEIKDFKELLEDK